MPHIIEIWTMAGEERATYTAACLTCGWVGERRTRLEAEAEGRLHEEGEGTSAPSVSRAESAPDQSKRGGRGAR